MALTLTIDERAELERRVRSLKIRSENGRRARALLMLADGESYSTIESALACYRDYQSVASALFWPTASRAATAIPRAPPTVLTPAMEARVGQDATTAAGRRYAEQQIE